MSYLTLQGYVARIYDGLWFFWNVIENNGVTLNFIHPPGSLKSCY